MTTLLNTLLSRRIKRLISPTLLASLLLTSPALLLTSSETLLASLASLLPSSWLLTSRIPPSLLASLLTLLTLLASPSLLASLLTLLTLLASPSLLASLLTSLLLNSLDTLEESHHFLMVHLAVSVGINLLDSLPDFLVVVWGSHTHLKAEISVSVEELLTFELIALVLVVFLEDLLHLLLKPLVVLVVPSSCVVNLLVAVHLMMLVALSPSVSKASLLTMVTMVTMVTMATLLALLSSPSLLAALLSLLSSPSLLAALLSLLSSPSLLSALLSSLLSLLSPAWISRQLLIAYLINQIQMITLTSQTNSQTPEKQPNITKGNDHDFSKIYQIIFLQGPKPKYLNMTSESAQAFNVQALIFVIILVIYVLTSHIIENRKIPYLHQSSIAIIMGILTSIIAKYVLEKTIDFSNQLFFALILPPIIFSAGYSLRKSLFFQNFGMISFLGIIGTIIGFMLLSGYLILLNQFFQILTLTEILILASVMCATDTVAANSLIRVERFPTLNAVLFGEGIINDAVAIILFGTISKLKLDQTGGQFTFKVVGTMALDFCYLFFFSVAFGTLSGFGLSYLFKIYESINKHPIKETSLILLNGYLTYLLGQLMGLSGIITLFTCAIIMGHYSYMNISDQSQKGTGLAFQTVSYIAEAFVFSYLGASVLSVGGEWLAVLMAFLILVGMPFIRAIMVWILPLVYKLLKKKFLLTNKELIVCWFQGQVRGVIAFALCLQIDTKHKKIIMTVAMVIVMATTLIGSTFLAKLIKYIKLENKGEIAQKTSIYVTNNNAVEKPAENLGVMSSKYKTIGGYSKEESNLTSPKNEQNPFQKFQKKYLKRIFTKEQQNQDLDLTYTMHEHDKKEGTSRRMEVEDNQNQND